MSSTATISTTASRYRFAPQGNRAIWHLYNLPAQEVDGIDLAEMNLISAYGLPGAKGMDMLAMLATLDEWAGRVRKFTAKSRKLFLRNPTEYGTFARFQVGAMLRTITRECGVGYNPDRIIDRDNFDDPADSFIHGLLGPRRTGTCASLPVLAVAIGRRLGYPLKLVLAPAHCFFRWDAPDERFNVEYHEKGMNIQPDEHYTHWPYEWNSHMHEHERRRPMFLVSMTTQQELAYCAHTRASQLDIAGRRAEAVAAARVAYDFWPTNPHGVWVTHLMTKAVYLEQAFPHLPCEETAGPAATERMAREKGVVMVNRPSGTMNL